MAEFDEKQKAMLINAELYSKMDEAQLEEELNECKIDYEVSGELVIQIKALQVDALKDNEVLMISVPMPTVASSVAKKTQVPAAKREFFIRNSPKAMEPICLRLYVNQKQKSELEDFIVLKVHKIDQ